MRGGEGVKLANEEGLLRVPNGDTRDPMCHDVMAEGRQRGRDPVRGSLQGREGVANSLSRLAHRALCIQTQGSGGREIQFANFFYCWSKLFAHITILFVCSEHKMSLSLIKVLELES